MQLSRSRSLLSVLAVCTSSAILMVGLPATPALAAPTGSCPTASLAFDGSGTTEDPYLISTPADLQLLWQASTDAARGWTRTASYRVTADIDMTASGSTCTWDQGIGYVASDLSGFDGTFDGAGHVISDLNVSVSNDAGDAYAGLFYFLNTNAVVSDLVFTGAVSAVASGDAVAGPIAAANSGALQGAGAHGTALAQNTSGTVGVGAYAGGLVGANDGTISGSFALGDTQGTAAGDANAFVGGLVGNHYGGSISASASSGAVTATANLGIAAAGGIAGSIESATLDESYTLSSVAAMSGGSAPKGGLAGTTSSASGTVTSFWNSARAANAFGSPTGSIAFAEGKSLADLSLYSTYQSAGWDMTDGYAATTWNMCPAFRNGLPFQHRFVTSNPCMTLSPSSQTVNAVTDTAITPTSTISSDYFTGPVTYSVAPTLPAGLTLNTSTGVISGTPTTVQSATTYTITGTHASETATTTVSITVTAAAITPATQTVTGVTNTALTPTTAFTATGFSPASVTYSSNPATLPAGLTLNTSTGVISGTPTAVTPATTFTITASNGTQSASATVSITITAASITPATQTVTGVTNTALTPTTAFTATGFSPASVTYSSNPATLPAGLTLNTSTGVISGTPTAVTPATTFTITASNGTQSASATVSITVLAQTITPATQTITAYREETITPTVAYTATGFPSSPPISYGVSPELPSGLSLNSATGVISGKPTIAKQAATYTITATSGSVSATATVSITVSEPSAPSAPLGVTVVPGDGQATVTWREPQTTGGSAILTYEVLSTPGAKTCTATAPALTCTVTGLENGVPHTVTVRAQNVMGWSAPSAPSATFTPSTTTLTAPSKVRATPGNAKATVRWAAASAPVGQTITGYRVIASPGGQECTTQDKRVCVVEGLTNGTSYTFTVLATTEQFTSAPSSPSEAVTPRTVPGKVRNFKAVRAGKGALRLTWQAPSSTGGVSITGYEFRVNSRPWQKTKSLNAVVRALNSKQPVRLSVRALNSAGNGPQVSIRATPL